MFSPFLTGTESFLRLSEPATTIKGEKKSGKRKKSIKKGMLTNPKITKITESSEFNLSFSNAYIPPLKI